MILDWRPIKYRGGSRWLAAGVLSVVVGVAPPEPGDGEIVYVQPAEYTIAVEASDRTVGISAVDRTVLVDATDRTVTVAGVDRTILVEPRPTP